MTVHAPHPDPAVVDPAVPEELGVLICDDAPLESEANASIRTYIRQGWIETVGAARVVFCGLSAAAGALDMLSPSMVLCIGSYLPETAYFGEISRAARAASVPLVFWATEDPYEKDASHRIEPFFDAIFTCDRGTCRYYDHPMVFHLPLAGSPAHHQSVCRRKAVRPIDVLFCGVAFANRREILSGLRPHLADLKVAIVGPGWSGLGPGCSDRRVNGPHLMQLYAQSRIVLNLGRSLGFENSRYVIAASTPGPRTFEAAMAGSLQLFHEDTLELRRYFDETQIPGFSAPADFAALRDRYLGSETLRFEAAVSAQRRALAQHSYAHRAREMIATLRTQGLL